MTQLKTLSTNWTTVEELKNYLIKDIVVIGVIDNSFRERMLKEPTVTLEKAIVLGQSREQMKFTRKN